MLFFIIFLGLVFGSFLNVIIYRLPINQSIIFPASYCPHCKNNINWLHNIPIVSFCVLKGRSNCCDHKISVRYPLVEFFSSILWVWSYYYLSNPINQVVFLIISSCLLVVFFTDLMHFFIPIELNVIIFLASLVQFLVFNTEDIKYHFFSMFLLSFYFLILMLITSYLLKRETMGYGDIILIGVVTFWLGLFDGFLIIFFASLLSIFHWLFLKIVKKSNNIVLPFGSTISLSAILIFSIRVTLQLDTNLF